MDRKVFYTERLQSVENSNKQVRLQLRWMAWLRLLVFLAIFPGLFVILPHNIIYGLFFILFFLVCFLWLLQKYQKLEENYNHLKVLTEIVRDEINATRHNYSVFAPGDEFIDTTHPFSYDMDLFGQGSLYQYLNRTVTIDGGRKLAGLLQNVTPDTDTILQRQAAVKELGNSIELLHDFRAGGAFCQENESDIDRLKEWIEQPLFYLRRKGYLFLASALPVCTLLSLVLAFFIPFFRTSTLILYLIQLAVVAYRLKHTTPEHSLLSKRLGVLKKYGNLLTVIEKKRYSALLLAGIGDSLLIGGNSAAVSIQKLSRLVSAFDNRLNLLAALFLEGILLWDIQCMIRLERWKSVQGRHLTEWIDAIGEFDAYSSLANFSFNHQQFSVPEFSDRAIIETSGMGHVLIPPDECILNDFTITNAGDFIIITGANMAGKSTFLRTVVTNMILAFAGAPVCAEKFSVKPITLFSSMRTNDSLNKHESYFYAELKRLKELLDRMRNGEKLFVVLDEILKGTNSTDKQRGSRSALEQILMLGGTGIIATHDLELATIEKLYPGKVKNMCFEIEIDRAEISFDYKLRGGITTKMNALLLMQQMGIVPEGYHTD